MMTTLFAAVSLTSLDWGIIFLFFAIAIGIGIGIGTSKKSEPQ